jgi:hypothetical protein
MPSNILLPRRAVLEIQEGGAGASAWKSLATLSDVSLVRLGAVDSGEVEISRYYGRDERTGRLKVIASSRTGTAPTYTADVEIADAKVASLLEALNGKKNLRVRMFTGEYANPTNYERIRVLSRAWNKKPKGGFSRDMVNSFEGFEDQADAQRRTFPHDVDDFLELDPLVVQDIKGTVTTLAINAVLSVGYPRWAGEVAGENQNNPGNKEYLAGTVKTGVGQPPNLLYTANKGATWTVIALTGLNDFTVTGIAKVGGNIVISGSDAIGGGLAYASYDAVKSGTVTFTRSTGIAAGTVVSAVATIDSNTVIACGPAGAVYISTDGGRTFASAGTAVTANALTCIAVVDSSLQWFGGASGTLVRRYKGVMSTITVTGLSTNAINSLAVPTGLLRGTELYVGSAAGNIYVTVNGTATTPTWATRAFDSSGVGAVDGLAFGGPDGEVLFILQTNGSSQSRVLLDLSGGMLGNDVAILGSFTSPANATFNALAVADENTAMVVGDVQSGQGMIALVA